MSHKGEYNFQNVCELVEEYWDNIGCTGKSFAQNIAEKENQ
jgi:hypothetical protein